MRVVVSVPRRLYAPRRRRVRRLRAQRGRGQGGLRRGGQRGERGVGGHRGGDGAGAGGGGLAVAVAGASFGLRLLVDVAPVQAQRHVRRPETRNAFLS